MVVKNLLYIEQQGLGQIDWDRITTALPLARTITLDIEKDSYDPFIQN